MFVPQPPPANAAALPARTIGLDLMGIHDAGSRCLRQRLASAVTVIERTKWRWTALRPAAHATMLPFFGTGNDRCVACHEAEPNFYNFASGMGSLSAMALREQMDMEEVQLCRVPWRQYG